MRAAFLSSLLLLTACPEPPQEGGEGMGGTPGQPDQPAQPMPPGEPGDPGQGGSPGTGGAGPAVVQMDNPELTQEALSATEGSVQVQGELSCEGSESPFWIMLLPPPPAEGEEAQGDGGGPIQAITTLKVQDGPGEFTLWVPADREVVVLAYEDQNEDDLQTPGEALLMASEGESKRFSSGDKLSIDCVEDRAAAKGAPEGAPPAGSEQAAGGGPSEPSPAGGEAPPEPPPEGGEAPPEGGEAPPEPPPEPPAEGGGAPPEPPPEGGE